MTNKQLAIVELTSRILREATNELVTKYTQLSKLHSEEVIFQLKLELALDLKAHIECKLEELNKA